MLDSFRATRSTYPTSSSRLRFSARERKKQPFLSRPCESRGSTAPVLRRGIAEDEIIAYATHFEIAPMVIGRRQRSAVERIYVGSTTSAVLSKAACPILVVPPLGSEEIC